jgi:Flp pilus assembly protein TadD
MAPFLCSRPFGPPALALAFLAVAAAGCQTMHPTTTADTTGSVGLASSLPAGAPNDGEPRRELDAAGALYRANAGNPDAAIRYAAALRAIGERAQASAVLEQASIKHPSNKTVLGAYGRALADAGNYAQAFEILGRAHTPDQPDWRLLSVQGAVLDQMGRHEEARRYYASALKLAPENPAVLSNLGLSYALSKDLKQAETILRRAAVRPDAEARVRQNLALVVGLQGRYQEAEEIARADLPPEAAAANVAYLREMLSGKSDWKKLGRTGAIAAASSGS